jgi:hypothetical protein
VKVVRDKLSVLPSIFDAFSLNFSHKFIFDGNGGEKTSRDTEKDAEISGDAKSVLNSASFEFDSTVMNNRIQQLTIFANPKHHTLMALINLDVFSRGKLLISQ